MSMSKPITSKGNATRAIVLDKLVIPKLCYAAESPRVPNKEFPISTSLAGEIIYSFIIPHMILKLLVLEPHFENCCCIVY